MSNGSEFGYASSDLAKARQEAARQSLGTDDSTNQGEDILGTGLGIVGGIVGAIYGGPAGAAVGYSAGQHVGKGIADLATNKGDEALDNLSGGVLGAVGLVKPGKKKPTMDPTAGAGDEVPDSIPDTGDVSGVA